MITPMIPDFAPPRTASRYGSNRRASWSLSLSIVVTLLCASCSTVGRQSDKVVSLPKLGVTLDDGLQEEEASALAAEYFHRYVSGCGFPDKPQDDGCFWRVQLWGGFVPTDYGKLRIAKDGSEALLEPPKGGFKDVTRELLRPLRGKSE